jgi:hypothetical protein
VRGPLAGGFTHFVVTVAGGGGVSPRGGSLQSLSVADSPEEAYSPKCLEEEYYEVRSSEVGDLDQLRKRKRFRFRGTHPKTLSAEHIRGEES